MQKEQIIPRLHETSFDWLLWRNGNLVSTFNLPQRSEIIKANRYLLREHAIGWCESDNLVCRPKKGYIAVMFSYNDLDFWTHFTKDEFETILGNYER